MSNFIFAFAVVLYLMFRFPSGPKGADESFNSFVMWASVVLLIFAVIADFAS